LGRTGRLRKPKETDMIQTNDDQELRTFARLASEIKVGDVYKDQEISEVKVGRKWVYLTGETKTFELYLGDQVAIQRWVKTDEAKEREALRSREEWIIRQIAGWKPATPKAMESINETVAKNQVFSSFQMADLIAAQANDKVWARYIHAVNYMVEKEEMTFSAAHDKFVAELTKTVLSAAASGSFRSSSVVSNVMDEADVIAMASFLRWGV
jgi:hypothetical protein